MARTNSFAVLIALLILGAGTALVFAVSPAEVTAASTWIGALTIILALIALYAIKIADQWEKAVILRLGRFRVLAGPGLFFIIPVIDTVPYWIDTRVITTTFKAERTLTKDTVPVDVDAVLFWKVLDAQMAALNVADYRSAISWAAQTALRDVIGKTMLADMLEGREKIEIGRAHV